MVDGPAGFLGGPEGATSRPTSGATRADEASADGRGSGARRATGAGDRQAMAAEHT
jgi:hypothetical protein